MDTGNTKCRVCEQWFNRFEGHSCAGPRIDIVDPRDAEIARLREQVAALEAQCAGMRATLEYVHQQVQEASEYRVGVAQMQALADAGSRIHAALRDDSGTHLLARLRELEAVYTAAQELAGWGIDMGATVAVRGVHFDAFLAALAKVAQQQGEV